MTNLCRHIRPNGTRGNSPALRQQVLCYFHHRERSRFPNLRPAADRETFTRPQVEHILRDDLARQYYSLTPESRTFELPTLEDHASIQLALSLLLRAMAQNEIDPKRAGMMLYLLQIASANIRNIPDEPAVVTDVVLTPDGHELAPAEDFSLNSPEMNILPDPSGNSPEMKILQLPHEGAPTHTSASSLDPASLPFEQEPFRTRRRRSPK